MSKYRLHAYVENVQSDFGPSANNWGPAEGLWSHEMGLAQWVHKGNTLSLGAWSEHSFPVSSIVHGPALLVSLGVDLRRRA